MKFNFNDITYLKTIDFDNQFNQRTQQTVGPITIRLHCCLVSAIEAEYNEYNKYLQERERIVHLFNTLASKRIQTDANLSLDSFKILRHLGEGSYGAVFLAYHFDTNEYMALKAVQKSLLAEANEQHSIILERQYAFALRHPNIVQIITSFKDNEYAYLALEWLSGGDLNALMTNQKLTEHQARFYAAQIVMALDYLHRCRVIFRDLKPENIALTQRGYIKLIDLGLAKLVRGYTKTFCGTPHYIAPEIILHQPYTVSPDYWALGIVIHEMVTGDVPYDRTSRLDSSTNESASITDESNNRSMSALENNTVDIIRSSSKHFHMYIRIINGCVTMKLGHLSESCASIIRHLLQHNVEHRLGCSKRGAQDVIEHPWFEQINFWALYQQKYLAPFIPIRKYVNSKVHDNETILKFTAKDLYENEFKDF